MKEPLIPNILEQREQIYEECATCDRKVIDRLTYIFKQVGRVCGFSFSDWHVYDASPHNYGDVFSLFIRNKINVNEVSFNDLNGTSFAPHTLILLKDKKINVKHSIPKRWLFENFEEELREARRLYIQKENHQKNLIANMKTSAKAKLSAKEIRILGL